MDCMNCRSYKIGNCSQSACLESLSWKLVLKACFESLSWKLVLDAFLESLSWKLILKAYIESLSWKLALKACLESLPWKLVLKACLESLSWKLILKAWISIRSITVTHLLTYLYIYNLGGKTAGKNIEVCVSVLMSNGTALQVSRIVL